MNVHGSRNDSEKALTESNSKDNDQDEEALFERTAKRCSTPPGRGKQGKEGKESLKTTCHTAGPSARRGQDEIFGGSLCPIYGCDVVYLFLLFSVEKNQASKDFSKE